MRTTLVALALASTVVACQSYSTVPLSTVSVGAPVRLALTDRGRADLGPAIGASVDAIDGIVRSVDSAKLQIAVERVWDRDGLDKPWNHELVVVPRDAVATASERHVSALRSALVAAGIVGGAAVVGSVSGDAGFGGRTSGNPVATK